MALPSSTAIDTTDALAASPAEKISRPRRGIPRWLLPIIVHVALFLGEVLVWIGRRLSARAALRLSRWVTIRLEPLTRRRRSRNVREFFRAGRSPEQFQKLDRMHLDYLARMRLEVVRYSNAAPEYLRRTGVVRGEEHLRDALERRRGALLVSGHTATWWFVPLALALRGYPVTAIFTRIPFPRVERKLLALARQHNVKIAFVGRDAYHAARSAIENNEILYLTFDVTLRSNRAHCLPFGDSRLQVDVGPAIMAARHAMPTLQSACTYLDGERSLVSIYRPEPAELAPQTIAPEELCRLWTERLEKEVQRDPEQWWPWGYVDLGEPTDVRAARRARRRLQSTPG